LVGVGISKTIPTKQGLPNAICATFRTLSDEGFGDQPWVFCNSTGGPLRRSHFHANVIKPLLICAGLEPIRFHDLRHTSATLLLTAGVHPKVVQERLGHSQIGITLDTYGHVMPSLQLEAAEKLDGILAK
jgi:integrase